MKKLLLILPVALLFAACSKKNEAIALNPRNVTTADIEGKWQVTVDTAWNTVDGKTTAYSGPYGNNEFVFNFNQDGSGSVVLINTPTVYFTYSASTGLIKRMLNDNTEDDLTILSYTSKSMLVRELPRSNEVIDYTLAKE